MLRYVLTDLNQYFTNKESLLGWLFYVEVAAFLSPAIMVAGLACLQNMEWYRKKGIRVVICSNATVLTGLKRLGY
jgi:hypothetical protein